MEVIRIFGICWTFSIVATYFSRYKNVLTVFRNSRGDDSTAGQKNVKSDKLSLENGHLTSSHKLATVWPAALFILKIYKGCLIKQPAG